MWQGWWYGQNFLMLTLSLRLMWMYKETCCEKYEDQKLSKLCSGAGFLKNVGNGQFFITFDEEGPDGEDIMSRVYIVSK